MTSRWLCICDACDGEIESTRNMVQVDLSSNTLRTTCHFHEECWGGPRASAALVVALTYDALR